MTTTETTRPKHPIRRIAVVGVTAFGIARALTDRGTRRALQRLARYAAGRIQGTVYRVRVGGPPADVSDDILADRIRSEIGPLEKRLDVPRIHVMVSDHEAVLHGCVGSPDDERRIVGDIEAISGVRAVHSHLHIGLGAGDTRPSNGARRPIAV